MSQWIEKLLIFNNCNHPSRFKQDEQWSKIEQIQAGDTDVTFEFHRFWAQADVAIAFGTYGILFDE